MKVNGVIWVLQEETSHFLKKVLTPIKYSNFQNLLKSYSVWFFKLDLKSFRNVGLSKFVCKILHHSTYCFIKRFHIFFENNFSTFEKRVILAAQVRNKRRVLVVWAMHLHEQSLFISTLLDYKK